MWERGSAEKSWSGGTKAETIMGQQAGNKQRGNKGNRESAIWARLMNWVATARSATHAGQVVMPTQDVGGRGAQTLEL